MIACLSVPYFAAAVEQREDKRLVERAAAGLVVGGQPWEPQPVYAFSHEPASKGVRPGMSLRLAHVLSPQSHFIPAYPPRYFGAAGEITDVLVDFTHLVEPEALWLPPAEKQTPRSASRRLLPARYTLDLERLPQPEALALSREMGRVVRHNTCLAPAIGLADSKITAQIAATVTRPNHIRSVTGEQERQFLAERSVRFLPLDADAARRLTLLGIRTLGQLIELPPSSLQMQFGRDVLAFYRLIRNDGPWPVEDAGVHPMAPEKREQISYPFDAPVADLMVLENVLKRLASILAERLQASGMAAHSLQLSWQLDGRPQDRPPGTSLQTSLTFRSPVVDFVGLSQSLCEMFRQSCLRQAGNLRQGITELTVTASGLLPAQTRQLSLFEPAGDPLNKMVASLAAKHGSGVFFRPTLTDARHSLPERRFQLQAWGQGRQAA
jgi:nucleotidyltransferase/DNA polymerase involved in DNA repair